MKIKVCEFLLIIIVFFTSSIAQAANQPPENWKWLSDITTKDALNPHDLSVSISHLSSNKFPQFPNHDLILIAYKDTKPEQEGNLHYVLALFDNDSKALTTSKDRVFDFQLTQLPHQSYQKLVCSDYGYCHWETKNLEVRNVFFRTFSVATNEDGVIFLGYEAYRKGDYANRNGSWDGPYINRTNYETILGKLIPANDKAYDQYTVNDFSIQWDIPEDFLKPHDGEHDKNSISTALSDNIFIVAGACARGQGNYQNSNRCIDHQRIAFQAGELYDGASGIIRQHIVTNMDVIGGKAIDTDFAIGDHGKTLEVHKNSNTGLYYTENHINLPPQDPLFTKNNVSGNDYDHGRLPSIAYIGNDRWVTLHKGKSSDSQNISLFQNHPKDLSKSTFEFRDSKDNLIKTNTRSDIDGTPDGKVVIALAQDGKIIFRLAQVGW